MGSNARIIVSQEHRGEELYTGIGHFCVVDTPSYQMLHVGAHKVRKIQWSVRTIGSLEHCGEELHGGFADVGVGDLLRDLVERGGEGNPAHRLDKLLLLYKHGTMRVTRVRLDCQSLATFNALHSVAFGRLFA